MLPGLKNIDLDLCENCIYGKHKRVIFLRVGKEKKSEKLELVHTYVLLLRYHLSVALIIMLLLLMMQLEKLGSIVFRINLMYLILSRNRKIWLILRQEKS